MSVRKLFVFTAILFLSGFFLTLPDGVSGMDEARSPDQDSAVKHISRKQALVIAEGTEEAAGLYALNNGAFVNCIEKEVVRPCDSEWVTCVDDAWVARLYVGDACRFAHDGRLSVLLLIDDISGKIISRFPEAEYFQDVDFCVADADCLSLQEHAADKPACLNFLAGQTDALSYASDGGCVCRQSRCLPAR